MRNGSLRRTLALTLAFVVPLSIVAPRWPCSWIVARPTASTWMPASRHAGLIRQNMNWWSLLMLPLFVTLEAALVASVERSGDHWKQLCPARLAGRLRRNRATVLALV